MKNHLLFGMLLLAGLTACNARYKSPAQPDFHPTPTYSPAHSNSPTNTPPFTDTTTPSATASLTTTETASLSLTETISFTPSPTCSHTSTTTNSPTFTKTATAIPSYTWTPTQSLSKTHSPTFTSSITASPTSSLSPTDTRTATLSPTHTPTKTITQTPYFTPCQTLGAIIFTSSRDGYGAIYTMNPDGSGQTPFMQMSGAYHPKWSPGRRSILLGSKIFDSGGNLQATLSIGSLDTWSGNGTLLATRSLGWTAEFWAVEPDGSNPIHLSTVNTGYQTCGACPLQMGYAHAAWSPDRTQIAFARPTTMWTEELFVMNSDGSNLTSVSGVDYSYKGFPVWSPDGSKIAYCTQWDNLTGEVVVINADGSNKQYITHMNYPVAPPSRMPLSLAWSPDGSQFVFEVESIYTYPQPTTHDLWVVNVDGTGLTQLTIDGNSHSPDWR